MNGKIDGTSPQSLRPATTVGAGGKGSGSKSDVAPVGATAAADSVELSGEAAGLASLEKRLAEAPVADSARVASVRAALEAGTYRIDPQAIAARLAQLERELGA